MPDSIVKDILSANREWRLVQGDHFIAYLTERPAYCDRGRVHANIEVPLWRSDADPWPRYYFNVEHAKEEVVSYLKAKKIDLSGTSWVCGSYNSAMEFVPEQKEGE